LARLHKVVCNELGEYQRFCFLGCGSNTVPLTISPAFVLCPISCAEIKLTLLFDIVRTLEPAKGNTMLSTSHCEMVLMMTRMSKCSDRYVSVMLYAHTFVQSIIVSLVIMDLAMSPRDVLIISGLDHYKCIVPLVANSLQCGRFWARSIALVHDSPWESRSFCTVFIQVIRGRPGGLFQYTEGEEVQICLASTLSSIRAICRIGLYAMPG